jgi:hypothetical protein
MLCTTRRGSLDTFLDLGALVGNKSVIAADRQYPALLSCVHLIENRKEENENEKKKKKRSEPEANY